MTTSNTTAMIDACALNNMGVSAMTHGEYEVAIGIFTDALAVVQHVLQADAPEQSPMPPMVVQPHPEVQTKKEEEHRRFDVFRKDRLQVASSCIANISTRTTTTARRMAAAAVSAATQREDTYHQETGSAPAAQHNGGPNFRVVENDDLHCLIQATIYTGLEDSMIPLLLIRKTDYNIMSNESSKCQSSSSSSSSCSSNGVSSTGEMESGTILYNYGVAISCFIGSNGRSSLSSSLNNHKTTNDMGNNNSNNFIDQLNKAFKFFVLSHTAFLNKAEHIDQLVQANCTTSCENDIAGFRHHVWEDLEVSLLSIISLRGAYMLVRQQEQIETLRWSIHDSISYLRQKVYSLTASPFFEAFKNVTEPSDLAHLA